MHGQIFGGAGSKQAIRMFYLNHSLLSRGTAVPDAGLFLTLGTIIVSGVSLDNGYIVLSVMNSYAIV